MSEPVKVKGTALSSTVRYIQEKFGEGAVEKVIAALPEIDKATIRNGVLVSSWYPFSLLVAVMRGAKKEFGAGAPDIYRDIGGASADYSLSTVYKIFFKVGSPQFIIGRAATVYGNFYSSGEMKVLDSGKGFANVQITGFAEPCDEYCQRVWGWMVRMLELTGARNIKAVHSKCRLKGDALCLYNGTWD